MTQGRTETTRWHAIGLIGFSARWILTVSLVAAAALMCLQGLRPVAGWADSSVRSSGTQEVGTGAPAVGQGAGEACVFLHPDAAMGQGHIAWGYRLDGGDYFEFGSTDDVNSAAHIDKGQPNGFWEKDGTRQDMLGEFRRLGYKQYRCRPTDNNDITAAEEAATGPDGAEYAGYDLFGNNCLDHSVRILTAYGASQFPPATLHPQPKNWFIQFLSPWSGPTDL